MLRVHVSATQNLFSSGFSALRQRYVHHTVIARITWVVPSNSSPFLLLAWRGRGTRAQFARRRKGRHEESVGGPHPARERIWTSPKAFESDRRGECEQRRAVDPVPILHPAAAKPSMHLAQQAPHSADELLRRWFGATHALYQASDPVAALCLADGGLGHSAPSRGHHAASAARGA